MRRDSSWRGGHEEFDPRTQGLLRYLIVIGCRCAHGHHAEVVDAALVVDDAALGLATLISNTIANYFGTRIATTEARYLASLLGNSALPHTVDKQMLDAGFFEDVVNDCINEIKRVYGRDFSADENLRRGLVAHLYSTCSRMSIDAVLSLPMLSMVKAQYFEAYDYAVMCGHLLLERYGLRSNEDSLGYIAMHFAAAIERQHARDHFTVLLVCESGRGTSELLRTRLEMNFPSVCVSKTLSRAQLAHEDFSNVYLVVSTVPIDSKMPIPCVLVSPLFGNDDAGHVSDYLEYFRTVHNVKSLFTPELFFPRIEADSKEAALAIICERLIAAGAMDKRDEELLRQREEISSTEINTLVAMPHCIREGRARTCFAIFTTTYPVDWKYDNAQIIIPALISREAGIEREVFPTLYRLTQDTKKMKRLAKITEFESFIDELFRISTLSESARK